MAGLALGQAVSRDLLPPQEILSFYIGEEAASACTPKQLIYTLEEETFSTPSSPCK